MSSGGLRTIVGCPAHLGVCWDSQGLSLCRVLPNEPGVFPNIAGILTDLPCLLTHVSRVLTHQPAVQPCIASVFSHIAGIQPHFSKVFAHQPSLQPHIAKVFADVAGILADQPSVFTQFPGLLAHAGAGWGGPIGQRAAAAVQPHKAAECWP